MDVSEWPRILKKASIAEWGFVPWYPVPLSLCYLRLQEALNAIANQLYCKDVSQFRNLDQMHLVRQ